MQVIVSHPTGNANVKAVVKGLADAGLLQHYYTTIAVSPGSFLSKLSGLGPLSELKRRSVDPAIAPYLKTSPWSEAGRIIAPKIGMRRLVKHEEGFFSVDKIYHRLDRHVANKILKRSGKKADAVYCYEDGAEATFEAAKKAGITRIYDLPIGYWRAMHQLLKAEVTNRPDWAMTLAGFQDSEPKLARKDRELKLADHIFCASSFTAETLKSFPEKLGPVSVIPYGFPDVQADRTYAALSGRPLRVLFVGGLSQRKGIANLLEAVNSFGKNVELTIVGNTLVKDCKPLNEGLARHRWIPSLPHADILKLMKQHDVFVFPSLFEGFGLVITEAMSQGTPVITTERTAGPDLITHNENGWLVKAGDTTALKQSIENLLLHPEELKRAGQAAMKTAGLRPWKAYEKATADAVAQLQKN